MTMSSLDSLRRDGFRVALGPLKVALLWMLELVDERGSGGGVGLSVPRWPGEAARVYFPVV